MGKIAEARGLWQFVNAPSLENNISSLNTVIKDNSDTAWHICNNF